MAQEQRTLRRNGNGQSNSGNQGRHRPEFMMVFHSGDDMKMKEVKKQIRGLRPADFRIKLYEASPREKALLASPLGQFNGRKKIKAGLSALRALSKMSTKGR